MREGGRRGGASPDLCSPVTGPGTLAPGAVGRPDTVSCSRERIAMEQDRHGDSI